MKELCKASGLLAKHEADGMTGFIHFYLMSALQLDSKMQVRVSKISFTDTNNQIVMEIAS